MIFLCIIRGGLFPAVSRGLDGVAVPGAAGTPGGVFAGEAARLTLPTKKKFKKVLDIRIYLWYNSNSEKQ